METLTFLLFVTLGANIIVSVEAGKLSDALGNLDDDVEFHEIIAKILTHIKLQDPKSREVEEFIMRLFGKFDTKFAPYLSNFFCVVKVYMAKRWLNTIRKGDENQEELARETMGLAFSIKDAINECLANDTAIMMSDIFPSSAKRGRYHIANIIAPSLAEFIYLDVGEGDAMARNIALTLMNDSTILAEVEDMYPGSTSKIKDTKTAVMAALKCGEQE